MKRTSLTILAACTLAMAMGADASYLKVDRLNVERQGDRLSVAVEIDPADIKPGRDREVVFTPVLRSLATADSLELPQVVIAGKNRYLLAERHGFTGQGSNIYRAGQSATASIGTTVPFEDWMKRSRLVMRQQTANCCDPLEQGPETPLAELDFERKPYGPEMPYIALTGDSVVELTAEGRAYIDFVVNRTEIKPTYRRNRIELAKIIESIDRVRNDSMCTVTALTFKGYASPEGPYSNNVRLAMGRTNALKEYVRGQYGFPASIMSSDYEPEDWEGLRRWMEQSTLPHREQLLQIIDSDMEPDYKDHYMRAQYPQEYALVLDSVYPALRHSDYTVKYAIRTTVDVEKLKQMMRDTPERLRPVDFYRIAASYPTGCAEYEQALMKAVEMYPYDAEANINAANISIRHGDYEAAARYADRGGERPEAMFTRAVLADHNGDRARALNLMHQAAQAGFGPAVGEAARLDELEGAPKVTYLIEAAH